MSMASYIWSVSIRAYIGHTHVIFSRNDVSAAIGRARALERREHIIGRVLTSSAPTVEVPLGLQLLPSQVFAAANVYV